MSSFVNIANLAMDEIRTASNKTLYQTDYSAWKSDVLGYRTYAKMEEITNEALFGKKTRTVIKSSNGTAKALALDTPMLTTSGWKTMGSLEVGDFVFGEDGAPVRVRWKSEVFVKDTYRVSFDDGAEIICSGEHEWATLDLATRSRTKKATDWRQHWDRATLFDTRGLADTAARGSVANHLIPLAAPVQFATAELPVDPYTLGAWLGDGTSIRAEISCHEDDSYVIAEIESRGYSTRKLAGKYTWSLAGNGLTRHLRSLGIFGSKAIPDEYMYSGIEQRIDLVRGLMDTDGTADKRGSMVAFGQSNPALIGQFCDLLASLGVRFRVSQWQPPVGKIAYVVAFKPSFDPFTPGQRKSRVFNAGSIAQASRMTGRTVVNIERVTDTATQCIEVESESHLYLAGSYLVPTHNSFEMACMIGWVVSVFPVGESLAIVSAPSIPQLEKVIFAYLKTNYNVAMKNGNRLPGWIDEQLSWKYATPAGNVTLAFGRKPPDQDAVSTFQGVRSNVGRTFVFFDEAGGMSREMYTAAEAVMTGADSRFFGIGNPDNTGTMFHDIFKDHDKYAEEYNRFTISSFDLPTWTGEVVYPDSPDMETRMLKALTSRDWIEHKQRQWGEKDARYQSKVLGEFPSEGSNAFFPTKAIDDSFNNVTIKEDGDKPIWLGVDVARWGQDESVIYSNQGGRVRLVDSWGKCDTYESEQRIHAHAKRLGATEVRVDASGIGGAIFDHLEGLPEFADKTYILYGIDGGARPPDSAQHHNNRAYNHDSLRDQMIKGKIDLDFDDKELKKQLEGVTFRFTQRGAVQITPKDEQRTELGGSPDRLDAAIYATVSLDWLDGPTPGEVIDYDVDMPVAGMAFYSMGSIGW